MSNTKIALIGNPNAGKSSLFNQLTGLNQHVGNYPGVTVDKHYGSYGDSNGDTVEVIDLPGTYSLFARSGDEEVACEILSSPDHPDFPDLVVVVADVSHLERSLLLFTQVLDLKLPVILTLSMTDLLDKEGLDLNQEKLSEMLGGPQIVPINARNGEGVELLKEKIAKNVPAPFDPFQPDSIIGEFDVTNLPPEEEQVKDTNARYKKIKQILLFCLKKQPAPNSRKILSQKIDKWVTHPIGGYAIFLGILFVIFQAIYKFATVPMDMIDGVFGQASQWIQDVLPGGVLTDLLAQGIVPGIGGVVIFIPQIVLLFAFLALLEEVGYMSRVVFIMDRLMRPLGLHGKSVVPLISGVACAIPAIMATRGIDQWKDRLVTIMVVPLMSCSARLPVYVLLIALVIPEETIFGFVDLQGLVLMGMYLLGTVAALAVSWVFKLLIKTKRPSFLIMELPTYKNPRWQNVGLTLIEKTKVFVFDAGKVILAISIILWVMASYGPPGKIDEATRLAQEQGLSENEISSKQLESSWIGLLGKQIEPVIKPLGYDWQIGIALITSFAAREVFVGSMATIYSVGEDFEEGDTLLKRMKEQRHPDTGEPVYSLAAGLSLMIFYAFAMQCMSTLAITRRETKSWKWPLLQTAYMTGMAYIGAWIAFQLVA